MLGPNGAGKSTLFNLIAGVLPPNEGTISFMGRDVTTMKVWLRRRLGIGRTYQVPKPFAHMSVFENVLVAATHGGGLTIAAARAEAQEALSLTGLGPRGAKPAGALSLLDLKRLELAKAVAVKPRLLLLDEIAGGLTDAECEDLLTNPVRHPCARADDRLGRACHPCLEAHRDATRCAAFRLDHLRRARRMRCSPTSGSGGLSWGVRTPR